MSAAIDTTGFAPHELRVVEERAQLAERMGKLELFIGTDPFRALGMEDKMLLREQFSAMHTLDNVLTRRIARFVKPDPNERVLVFWEQKPSDSDPLAQHAYRRAVPMSKVSGITIPACDVQQNVIVCTRQVAIDQFAARFE